jgi:hypothetical protein
MVGLIEWVPSPGPLVFNRNPIEAPDGMILATMMPIIQVL